MKQKITDIVLLPFRIVACFFVIMVLEIMLLIVSTSDRNRREYWDSHVD